MLLAINIIDCSGIRQLRNLRILLLAKKNLYQ